VAAVTSNVGAQSEAETSEAHWRKTFEETSREATERLSAIEQKWQKALELTVAEDISQQLSELKGIRFKNSDAFRVRIYNNF